MENCPHLPPYPLGNKKTHGVERGAGFYLDTLAFAQGFWQEGKPAQAILQLNKAFAADLRDDDPVLTEWPWPYAALAWILEKSADGTAGFLGNPVRHFQHLATRMSGPRREERIARAWKCFHLSRRVLAGRGDFPLDGRQIAREGIHIPAEGRGGELNPHRAAAMKSERHVTLRDGTPGIVRAIIAADGEALAGALEELGPESRVRRFLFDKTKLSPAEIARLSNPDGRDHIAYGLAVETEDGMTPIAVARCFRDKEQPDLAEIAIVIADAWQGKGAGTELIATLRAAALEVGIRRWFADMFEDNDAMKHLLSRFGRKCEERDLGNGVIEAIYDITA